MPKAKRKISELSSFYSTPASIRSPLGARKNWVFLCMLLLEFESLAPFPTCTISKYQSIVPLRARPYSFFVNILSHSKTQMRDASVFGLKKPHTPSSKFFDIKLLYDAL
jgi:hypothetical protein